MNKIIKFLSLVLLSFLAFPCFAQKQAKYEYYGGHGCVDITLTLYSDSSYVYTSSNALPFAHTSTRSGYYLLSDSSITLFNKKRKCLSCILNIINMNQAHLELRIRIY